MSMVPTVKCTNVVMVHPRSENSRPDKSAASRVMLPMAKEKTKRMQVTTPMQRTTCFNACEHKTLNLQSSIEMLATSATRMAYKKIPKAEKI
eukprot:Skav218238  [mRNA]  locus=scaffold4566:184488:184763:- [translate_table: standard]